MVLARGRQKENSTSGFDFGIYSGFSRFRM